MPGSEQKCISNRQGRVDAHLVDVVLGLLGFSDPVLDHGSCELGVVEGVDDHLIIQNVALGLLQQPQDLVLQLLFRQPPTNLVGL